MSSGADATEDAVAEEQRHLDRLTAIAVRQRESAERRYRDALRTRDGYSGGLAERDALVRLHAQRVAELNAARHGLLLGRLGLDSGELLHVGRIGLSDQEAGERVLIDWRAPAARPFYTATPARRYGVRMRRHITSSGARVAGVHDEFLHHGTQGGAGGGTGSPAALFAALEKPRTEQMADIVQTIQAEQDEIIREDMAGTLVVQGGPGTGKTAVALHRAAFLLYEHRERLQRNAVLLVGPNTRFLRYISNVLPALGESSVVLATMATLLPGIVAEGTEAAAPAALKGDMRMAALIRNAVGELQCRHRGDVVLCRSGEAPVHIPQRVLTSIRRAANARRLPHNETRPYVDRMLVEHLATQALRKLGYSREELQAELPWTSAELANDLDVQALLDRLWPVLTAEQLLRSVLSSPELLAAAGAGMLDAREQSLLLREPAAPWTPADIPLLDEAAELLGEDSRARSREASGQRQAREREVQYAQEVLDSLSFPDEDTGEPSALPLTAEALADRQEMSDERSPAERAASDRTWRYGHVIVDEAQELSPMALRSLIRRASLRSMTLVGDMNQVSSRERDLTWNELLSPQLPRWRVKELGVNYRTPAQVMSLAARLLGRIDPDQPVPVSLREGTERPLLLLLRADHDVPLTAARVAGRLLDGYDSGTLGIIAPVPLLSGQGNLAAMAGGRTWVGSAEESKGLEFDTVLLVQNTATVGTARQDLARLYVALTRATQRLVIVAPEGWAEDAFAGSAWPREAPSKRLERSPVDAWLRQRIASTPS